VIELYVNLPRCSTIAPGSPGNEYTKSACGVHQMANRQEVRALSSNATRML
jgi:hypothetical protein